MAEPSALNLDAEITRSARPAESGWYSISQFTDLLTRHSRVWGLRPAGEDLWWRIEDLELTRSETVQVDLDSIGEARLPVRAYGSLRSYAFHKGNCFNMSMWICICLRT